MVNRHVCHLDVNCVHLCIIHVSATVARVDFPFKPFFGPTHIGMLFFLYITTTEKSHKIGVM